MRGQGKADAVSLRGRAAQMDGTAIIAEESKIPAFDPRRDYTGYPVGAPVAAEGQVWLLIQPHNAAHYGYDSPSQQRALWGLAHTTDPARAKPFVQSLGTSGMYQKGECCTDPGAEDPRAVYRAKQTTSYAPHEYPAAWELVKGDT